MGNTCKSQCQDRSITITLPDEEVRKKEAQLNALSNEPTKSTNAKGLKDMAKEKTQAKNDSDESSNDEDDDYYDPGTLAKLQIQNKGKNPRISVSAESYGAFNKKSDFKAKVIPKTSDQKNRIKLRISQAFMFAALEEKDLTVVIDAMEEKLVAPTDWVIKQGESGDHLYVVDSGELDCYKKYPNDTEPRHLKVYVPGESFGELALLYNAPRQASIQCKTRAVLFSLDRDTFNHIVKDSAMKKRQNYEDFLAKIELLTSMEAYERGKIAEAIKTLKFKQGESVVKEGEAGQSFFFLEEGIAVATKTLKPGQPPQTVMTYQPGGWFGELALLKNVPRQANIIAQTDLVVASLDRGSFKRLLGPLEDILKRNQTVYEKFSAQQ